VKLATSIIIAAWVIFGSFFLVGCETLGISLNTDFGRLTYEIPVRTLKDK
jgi:hypothetical protein